MLPYVRELIIKKCHIVMAYVLITEDVEHSLWDCGVMWGRGRIASIL